MVKRRKCRRTPGRHKGRYRGNNEKGDNAKVYEKNREKMKKEKGRKEKKNAKKEEIYETPSSSGMIA
jgi:hypothetical protein